MLPIVESGFDTILWTLRRALCKSCFTLSQQYTWGLSFQQLSFSTGLVGLLVDHPSNASLTTSRKVSFKADSPKSIT